MTVEQVLELTQAGFTADEIRTMMNPQQEQQDQEQEHPWQEQEQEQQERQEQTEDNAQNELNEMREAIKQLTKTIQAANVLNAHAGQKTMTVDEAADAAVKAFFKA
jgi:DNA-binding transcriptional MerR regulator